MSEMYLLVLMHTCRWCGVVDVTAALVLSGAFVVQCRPICIYAAVCYAWCHAVLYNLRQHVQVLQSRGSDGCSVGCMVTSFVHWSWRSLWFREKESASPIVTVRRYSLHGLCDRNSVCPSVCPSVRLVDCTVSTWFDLRSWFIHHMVAPSF